MRIASMLSVGLVGSLGLGAFQAGCGEADVTPSGTQNAGASGGQGAAGGQGERLVLIVRIRDTDEAHVARGRRSIGIGERRHVDALDDEPGLELPEGVIGVRRERPKASARRHAGPIHRRRRIT